MLTPYYLNINFRGIDISAKARLLHADGTKIYEIIFPTDEKLTLQVAVTKGGDHIWKDLNGNINELYQSLGAEIEKQDDE